MLSNGLIPIRPELIGYPEKSPTTAPSGRVRINAVQKRAAGDILVQSTLLQQIIVECQIL